MELSAGAELIVDSWLGIRERQKVLLITDEPHISEAVAIQRRAAARGAAPLTIVFPGKSAKNGAMMEQLAPILPQMDVIVGMTEHSLLTTDAVRQAVASGCRFLSLPLSTNNGASILESGFLRMGPEQAEEMTRGLLRRLRGAGCIRAVTAAGTDVTFSMAGRTAMLLSGRPDGQTGIGSSSFEVSIPVVEDSAGGTVVLDGSLGYLGAARDRTRLEFQGGYLRHIENTSDGLRLEDYIGRFHDGEMRCACEFGIGINYFAQCCGNSYVEDESAYGTFHIGFGRNLALGGAHDAQGHFDLVVKCPDILVDGAPVVQHGRIIV